MKLMNKLQKRKEELKKDNKGFSLVELIIVIAIMAILVGIVGTQVIPYINKSKEAKDFQIINSYGTAATTAYSSNAEKVTAVTTVTMDNDPLTTNNTEPAKTLAEEIQSLTGYDEITTNLVPKMGSKKGKEITKVVIQINPTDTDATTGLKAKAKTIVTQAYSNTGAAGATDKKLFDEVITQL